MPQFLFATKNVLKLGAPLAANGTTLTLASGQGANWPALSGEQRLQITLMDAATGAVTEVVQARNHTAGADTLTIVRGQEGTTAKAFQTGDYAAVVLTEAVWNNLNQQAQTKWVMHNSAEAAEWMSLAGAMTASANGELMVGIGDNTLKIRGIIRGTMGPNAQLITVTNKRPYGCTVANASYTHVWPSTGIMALNSGPYYTERLNTTGSATIALNGSFPSGASWIMVNIDIEYY